MTLPTMYTPEQVAERLKVTRRSVYAWLLEGRLKGNKAGDTWRIAEPEVLAFIESRKAGRVTLGPDHPDHERWLEYFTKAGLIKASGKRKGKRTE